MVNSLLVLIGMDVTVKLTARQRYYRAYKQRRRDDPEFDARERAKRRKWRAENADKARESVSRSMRKRSYGITDEEYYGLLIEQEGGCAICGRPCSTGHRLSVDHNHATGEIRGLLCRRHNAGLGHFNDDPALMRKAIKYLERKR